MNTVATHLRVLEKIPRSCLIVVAHAEHISTISDISSLGFSEISQVQASMPAEIEVGEKTWKGKATR